MHSVAATRRQERPFSFAFAWVLFPAAAMLGYATFVADSETFGEVQAALSIQILTWAVCVMIAAMRSPGNRIRISDPLVLTLGLSVAYLIYPSITWCQQRRLPFGVDISASTASSIFYLHALFLAGLTAGYVLANRRRQSIVLKADVRRLPPGWPLFVIGLLPLAATTISRLASGGGLIPTSTYEDEWLAVQRGVNAARSTGGLEYLLVQIGSKTWFYPIVAMGIGGGLLLARTGARSRGAQCGALLLIVFVGLMMMLLGDGTRHPALIYILVALVFADCLISPLETSVVVGVAVLALTAFLLFGYFRAYRNLGLREAAEVALDQYQRDEASDAAGEFTGMLAKEAAMLQITEEQGFEGPIYLVHSVLLLIPSQLLPDKFGWLNGADVLSKRLLGRDADKGAGVAGTTIGDGYYFAGAPGVAFLAMLFGLALGRIRSWSLQSPPGSQRPILLRLALAAGLTGFTYVMIRSDLSQILMYLLYVVVLPSWILNRLPLAGVRRWIRLLPDVRDRRPRYVY